MNKNTKRLTTALSTAFVATVAGHTVGAEEVNFTDINESYAKDSIEYLASKGIISGYEDGTFRPTLEMDRQTFAAFLAKVIGVPGDVETGGAFTDVSEWAKGHVGKLHSMGIVAGYSSTTFGAKDAVTREQMAVMYVRALGFQQEAYRLDLEPTFSDKDAISPWARPAVAFAEKMGFITSDDGNFNPKDAATREDVAALSQKYHQDGETIYKPKANEIILENADLLLTADTFINTDNEGSFVVRGTTQPNAEVSLMVKDESDETYTLATSPYTANANGNFSVSVDMSAFDDGDYRFIGTILTDGETTGETFTVTATKDTTGPLSVVIDNTTNITSETDQTAFLVTGSTEENVDVTVSLTDGTNILSEDTTADADGVYSASFDTSNLTNTTLTIEVVATDAAGNKTVQTATIDKEVGTLVSPTITNSVYLNASVDHTAYNVTGTAQSGADVTVSISDGTDTEAVTGSTTVNPDGTFSIPVDLSTLAEGELLFTLTQTVGEEEVVIEKNILMDITLPESLAIDAPEAIVVDTDQSAYTVSGTTEPGLSVEMTLSDGTETIEKSMTADTEGSFAFTLDTTSLKDGSLNLDVVVTDVVGNEKVETLSIQKDATIATPSVSISSFVNASNEANYHLTGVAEKGATINLAITDGVKLIEESLTADENGAFGYRADLSTFSDGSINVALKQTDLSGNVSDAFVQDVTKDVLAPETLTISELVAIDGTTQSDFAVSGTTDASTSLIVTLTDNNGQKEVATGLSDENGDYTIAIDPSTLAYGDITVDVEANDEAGNTISDSSTVTKEATAIMDAVVTNETFVNENTDQVNYRLTGTGEPTTTIDFELTDGTTTVSTSTIVNTDGTFQSAPADISSFVEGEFTVTMTQTSNIPGDTIEPVSYTYVKDTTAPEIATIDDPSYLNAYAETFGYTLTGTSEMNGTVQVTLEDKDGNTSTMAETSVDAEGNYTITLTDADHGLSTLLDGDLTVNVVSLDEAGNEGVVASATTVKNVNTPAAPTNTNTGFINENTAPSYLVTGDAQAGLTLNVLATDGTNEATATGTVNPDGTYSISLDTTTLVDGDVTLSITQTDANGDVSEATTATVTKDTSAPTTTTVSNTGYLNNDHLLNGYVVSGTAEAGSTVEVDIEDQVQNKTVTLSTTADDNGSYSVTFTSADGLSTLSDQPLYINVSTTDEAGNVSETASVNEVFKDTSVPTVPTFDTTGGSFVNDGIINLAVADENPFTFVGTAEVGTTVTVYVEDENGLVRQGETVSDGTYSVDVYTSVLSEGDLTVTVVSEETSGNQSEHVVTVKKDLTNPVLHSATAENVNENNVSAYSFTGSVDPTDTVSYEIFQSDGVTSTGLTGTPTVGSDGSFTVTGLDLNTAGLTDANGYIIEMTLTDEAGNTFVDSTTTFDMDTTDPAPITITNNMPIQSADLSNYGFSVVTEADATVSYDILDAGVSTGISGSGSADDLGDYAVTGLDLSGLVDKEYTLEVTVSDAFGNEDVSTSTIKVDTTLPTLDSMNAGFVNASNETAYTFDGTTEANATVDYEIFVAGGASTGIVGTVSADASGIFTVTGVDFSTGPADGAYEIHLTITDEAGNVTTDTSTSITKDTVITAGALLTPIATNGVVDASEQGAVTLSGTGAEAGANVSVVFTDGTNSTTAPTTTVDTNGDWTVTEDLSSLNDGALTADVTVSDAAGNSDTLSHALSKDTVTTTGTVTVPATINSSEENAVIVSGTGAEAGITVDVLFSDGSTDVTASVTADGSGNWTLSGGNEANISTLNDGMVNVSVTGTDTEGNTELQSFTLDKDTVAIAGTLSTPIMTDDVVNASEETVVILSGTGAEAGATIDVAFDDITTTVNAIQTVADASGNWSIAATDISTLVDGNVNANITVTDSLNNTNTSLSTTFAKDTTIAVAPTGVTATDADATTGATGADIKVDWTVSTDADISSQDIYVVPSGTTLDLATHTAMTSIADNTTATWTGTTETFDSTNTALAGGNYDVYVVAVDAAGNKLESTVATFTITAD